MVYNLSKKTLANTLRFLAIDAISAAHSGHPGMPLGMADLAEVLWNDFLIHNPHNPNWINRDRFVLSNGHGSMLLYALLHLTGYSISIEDLKQFRQLHSKTPGHPEYGLTPGVDATTGPLGQGLGMAVGMALAESLLAKEFNKENFKIIDHYTYCFVGDGCLMEGISHEVSALAGTLGLNKLIVFWDNNKISIDGPTKDWVTEDLPARFRAYQWNVITDLDGHDPISITKAIAAARAEPNRPSLLCCNTIIGYGSPNLAGEAKCHGTPFSPTETSAIRNNLAWEHPEFIIPPEIYNVWRQSGNKGNMLNYNWDLLLNNYSQQYPELFKEFNRRIANHLPDTWEQTVTELLSQALQNPNRLATRQSSKQVLDHIALKLPELFGGSADLATSDGTLHKHAIPFSTTDLKQKFNYMHFGVREFGMFSIMNGMALHTGFIPYGGTFLAFIDYARGAIRLSALMQQKIIYVLSHDSIGLGEDGPTHQPIEHLAMLRMTPNLSVWRPCDMVETIVAWEIAITGSPIATSCLVLSRQPLKPSKRTFNIEQLADLKKGGYILYEPKNAKLDAIIIASGSEVNLAMDAATELATESAINVRVVSMPNLNIFLQQPLSYQQQILPTNIAAKIAIEASHPAIWWSLVGAKGKVLGIENFGLSAPGELLFKEFNFTVAALKRAVVETMDAI